MEYNKTIDPRQLLKKTKTSTVTKVQLLDYQEIADSETTAFEELINLQKCA